MKIRQACTIGIKSIHVRGFNQCIAGQAHVSQALVIGHDENDIRFRSREFGIRFSGSDRSVGEDGCRDQQKWEEWGFHGGELVLIYGCHCFYGFLGKDAKNEGTFVLFTESSASARTFLVR